MKTLLRMIAVVVVAVLSVVAGQRLFRKLYTDLGTRYIVIDEELREA